jgi:mono/diheme cytochrome c family protein
MPKFQFTSSVQSFFAAATLFIGAAIGFPHPAHADDAALIKKGEYLSRAGDCVACHTSPDGKPFAGGLYLPTPVGDISVPNITPDKATGIGDWTDDQFFQAMHDGIGHKGEYLYPAFPFPWYTNVKRDDALAIKAYLFSLPPIDAPRKPLKLSFPFNIREALLTWRTLFFKPAKLDQEETGDPKILRGKYLVEGLGHCGECHNKHDVLGASQWSGRLEGGEIEGWYAPNITSDGRQGIGSWSEDELATFLKTGTAPGKGVVLGPMQETISESLSYLTDDDLHAMAAYLKSTAAKKGDAETAAVTSASDANAYLTYCSSCHRPDGKGVEGAIPALAGNGAVIAGGPENAIRVVLGGLPAAHGLAPMPAVGASMSDQDIADAVNYIRNAWGNSAPGAVGAGSIGALREKTQTLLAGNLTGGCPAPDDASKAVDASVGETLKTMKSSDLLHAIDDIVAKAKLAAPKSSNDDIINMLTAAYCRSALDASTLSPADRSIQIGNFSVLIYSQLNPSIHASK